MTIVPGGGTAYNVMFKADLSHLMPGRLGNLHIILNPEMEDMDYALIGTLRMIKPWHEWIAVVFPKPGSNITSNPTNEMCLKPIKAWIGDDKVEVEILRTDPWTINEASADRYSEGNMQVAAQSIVSLLLPPLTAFHSFCLGDAVHRHPPSHGLGSNTCVQDAYNLAWKVAYLEKGIAGRALLDTYTQERQPVGAHLVKMYHSQPLLPHSTTISPLLSFRLASRHC